MLLDLAKLEVIEFGPGDVNDAVAHTVGIAGRLRLTVLRPDRSGARGYAANETAEGCKVRNCHGVALS